MTEQNMLKFVDMQQKSPAKQSADKRQANFSEIYNNYSSSMASKQASRCSQCGVPFCQIHCPLSNNIPDWLLLTEAGRLQEAYEVSSATNTFPEICGRICPQDKLCEGSCVIEQAGHGRVSIGAIEKYITDTAWDQGWVRPIQAVEDRSESVGIIGAGPAGLAAAERLRVMGYKVSVYDRYDRIGGLMIYGIPNFKLDKAVVQRRADWLRDGDIEFRMNCEVGKDISFEELRSRHDAVLLATGVYQARSMIGDSKGLQLKGIEQALDYLTYSNRLGLGDSCDESLSSRLHAQGKKVVVVGGGDTAMDCVRTAVRQGAESVHCLYRRDRENMPGSLREVVNAEEEGVNFSWLTLPSSFHGKEDSVNVVLVSMMRLGSADASGRRQAVAIDGAGYGLESDMVIMALGFDPEDLSVKFNQPDLPRTRWGTVECNSDDGGTSLDGVFAAGDIVRGASLVVWAIRDGRDSATAIDKYLREKRIALQVA